MHSIIVSPGLAGNYPAAGALLALLTFIAFSLGYVLTARPCCRTGWGKLQQQFSPQKREVAQRLLSSLTWHRAGMYPLGLHQHNPEENLVSTLGMAGTM